MATKRENQLPDYRIVLLAVGSLLIFYLLLPIMGPFLMAAILAYICKPLVDRISLCRLGKITFGRTTATLTTMLLLFAAALLLLLIIVPMLQREFVHLIQRLPDIINLLRTRLEPWLIQYFGLTIDIDMGRLQEILSEHWQAASDLITPVLLSISKNGGAIIHWAINLLLVPVVLFYLLRDWHGMVGRIEQLIPRDWHEKSVTIAQEIDAVLAEFLRGQLSVMLLMTAFYVIGLWMVGLDLALPVALVAGMLGFVPYLGVGIGLLMALLASALQFSSPAEMLPVLAVFAAAQLLESFVLTPWLVGDRIGLHPLAVIFILLAGGQLFGFTGILLALPVGAALAVGLRHAKQYYLSSATYQKKDI
jgi:predicted PurR-regulated permease PerM